MSKEQYRPAAEDEHKTKDFLKKWGKRLAIVAIGLIGLSWII